jgi:NAD(P)-dependent dehydrogenase (short-subunit alcohol dehydrogenase family)
MKIAVVDGQGGGIGKAIIEHIKRNIKQDVQVIALGTNSLATSNMMKAGADQGATGENAIRVTSSNVDIIVGPIAILVTDSMLGEISENITVAIARSKAKKIVIPLNRCGVTVTGTKDATLQSLIIDMIREIEKEIMQ